MKSLIPALAFCGAALALNSWAISPADIQKRLSAGQTITLIDVRSTDLFKQGHIPNALSIPASLVPLKALPPLGQVVVYDDGLGPDTAAAAASALNRKPGITAQVLEGGFAAWQSAKAPTTASRGMQREEFPMITYDGLKRTPAKDVVLVDLRNPAASAGSTPQAKVIPQPLTDLQSEFPGTRVTRSPADSAVLSKTLSADAGKPPLLVLVDNGDGVAARAMSRTLKANGVKRFVILAGGEQILARKGQPGLERSGGGFTTPSPVRPAANK